MPDYAEPEERGLLDAGRVVDAIKIRWRQGEPPDMNGELTRHPELGSEKEMPGFMKNRLWYW